MGPSESWFPAVKAPWGTQGRMTMSLVTTAAGPAFFDGQATGGLAGRGKQDRDVAVVHGDMRREGLGGERAHGGE